jgi:hypothetical protein
MNRKRTHKRFDRPKNNGLRSGFETEMTTQPIRAAGKGVTIPVPIGSIWSLPVFRIPVQAIGASHPTRCVTFDSLRHHLAAISLSLHFELCVGVPDPQVSAVFGKSATQLSSSEAKTHMTHFHGRMVHFWSWRPPKSKDCDQQLARYNHHGTVYGKGEFTSSSLAAGGFAGPGIQTV